MRKILFGFFSLFLAACSVFTTDEVTPEPLLTATPAPEVAVTLAPTAEAIPEAAQKIPIRVWIVADLVAAPEAFDESLYMQQIEAFEEQNPAYSVEVRVKRATGSGGILDSMRTASAAAPDVLPDLIAFGSRNLQLAARDGSLQSLDLLNDVSMPSDILETILPDAYYEGAEMGIPFAGRSYISVYDSSEIAYRPVELDDLIENQTPFVFPAADNRALSVFTMYQTAGGEIGTPDDPYLLDMALFDLALGRLAILEDLELLSSQSAEFATPQAVWDARREFSDSIYVTDTTQYIANYDQVTNLAATLIPTAAGRTGVAMLETWHYAIVSEAPDKQLGASELLNYLLAPEQLGPWALDAGFVPLRESAAATWPANAPTTLVRQIYRNGVRFPAQDPIQALGPVIANEVSNLVLGKQSAASAVSIIATELQSLQN